MKTQFDFIFSPVRILLQKKERRYLIYMFICYQKLVTAFGLIKEKPRNVFGGVDNNKTLSFCSSSDKCGASPFDSNDVND